MRRLIISLYLIISTALLTSLIFWPLIRDGLFMSTDTTAYVNGAANLLHGNGFATGCPPGVQPIFNWGAGYSLALAALQSAGMSWYGAAQALALGCYAALTAIMFVFVFWFSGSAVTAGLAQLATALNGAILLHAGAALSEPLSWVLTLLTLIVLVLEMRRGRPGRTLLLAVLLSFAFLTRLANLALWMGAAIAWAVAAQRSPSRLRVIGFIIYNTVFIATFSLWLLRVWILSSAGENFGPPAAYYYDPLRVAFYEGLAMSKILFHMALTGPLQYILTGLLALALLAGGYQLLRMARPSEAQHSPAALVGIAAFSFLVGILLIIFFPFLYPGTFIIETRILSQSAILFVLLAASLSRAHLSIPRIHVRLPLAYILPAMALLYAVCLPGYYPALLSRSRGLYAWRDNQAMTYAAAHLDTRAYITPDYKIFQLWRGVCPLEVTADWAQPVKASLLRHLAPNVVFLNRTVGASQIFPEDIDWDVPATRLDFPDGSIYTFKP